MVDGNDDRLGTEPARSADLVAVAIPQTEHSALPEKTELQAWQERCAIVESALAAANDVLQRELPAWQERCAVTEGALDAANRRLDEELARWRERCELAEAALASLHDSRKGRPVSFTDTAAFLLFASRFSPARAVGYAKRRLGAETDGGYVMIDDIADQSMALSLGVGNETSWDLQMAELGVTIHQYDHTVSQPYGQPTNIVFHPKQIVDIADGSGTTLDDALAVLQRSVSGSSAILKIDIEGSEWSVLDNTPNFTLQRFDQIICEYHDFDRAVDPQWFERAFRVATKLDSLFQTVHVHGNNGEPIVVVGGVPFPSVLEVTYANRSRYKFEPTDEIFPTALDRPNHPGRPDLWLGSFSFP